MWRWINLYCFIWEFISKTRAACFIRGYKRLETIKALGLRSRAFICFSVFGTPDETLPLVFDIHVLPRNPFLYDSSGYVLHV